MGITLLAWVRTHWAFMKHRLGVHSHLFNVFAIILHYLCSACRDYALSIGTRSMTLDDIELSVSQATRWSVCSPYRMQRLAWSSAPTRTTPSLLHCVISTGCQCANVSTLRWAYWHTSASMAWLHCTWRRCWCRQYHCSNASDCVHRRRARCCSHARRPATVIVTSLWLVQLRGTVCPQNFDDQTCRGYVSSTTEELVIHCCVRWLLVH